MQRARHWLAMTCATVAVTAAACGGGSSGGGSSGPAGAVLDGIKTLAGAQTLTTTIRLDATPASLQALAHAGNAKIDPTSAAAIADASIVIETAKHDGKTDADVRVVEGSKPLFELRSTGDTLYLQADVRGILALAHKQNVFANLRAETKSMPSFVRAALNGTWVSLPSAALASLAQAGGSGTGGSAAQGIKVLNELRDVIRRDVTVTAAGSDSRGDHYRLSGDEKVLGDDLQSVLADAVPGGGLLGQRLPATSLTHRTIHLDAWIHGGALSAFSLDLAQFGDPGTVPAGTTLPLTVAFERSGGAIVAPSGAVPVDLTQLGTLVGALSGGGA